MTDKLKPKPVSDDIMDVAVVAALLKFHPVTVRIKAA